MRAQVPPVAEGVGGYLVVVGHFADFAHDLDHLQPATTPRLDESDVIN